MQGLGSFRDVWNTYLEVISVIKGRADYSHRLYPKCPSHIVMSVIEMLRQMAILYCRLKINGLSNAECEMELMERPNYRGSLGRHHYRD